MISRSGSIPANSFGIHFSLQEPSFVIRRTKIAVNQAARIRERLMDLRQNECII